MTNMAFEFLELIGQRCSQKPRKTGLTMVMDTGYGLAMLRDQLQIVGPYIDFAKIIVGSARLYQREILIEKLGVYEAFQIRPFLGGQFLEYVVATQGFEVVPRFMQEARDLGVAAVEVSDNCVTFTDDQRLRLIEAGLEAGLHIHGEVGSKQDKVDIGELIRQANTMLSAGCDVVLFEAAELVDAGVTNEDSIAAIHDSITPEQTMIELPGTWIKGVTLNHVYEMMKNVVRIFGTNANIGNVAMPEVLELECTRTGIGTAGPPTP